ncbi:MAG: hypothetical protein CMR00_08045 [[Chlorobium] sp. 445]|nr:MAG: hypothetical protein CMR00_08045 [[Chlorobium] sp. 445]
MLSRLNTMKSPCPTASHSPPLLNIQAFLLDTLQFLNPELFKAITPPAYRGYKLKVPKGYAATVAAAIENIPISERLYFIAHKAQREESLMTLAKQYHVSADALKQFNELKSWSVPKGSVVMIPTTFDVFQTVSYSLRDLSDDSREARYRVRYRKRYAMRKRYKKRSTLRCSRRPLPLWFANTWEKCAPFLIYRKIRLWSFNSTCSSVRQFAAHKVFWKPFVFLLLTFSFSACSPDDKSPIANLYHEFTAYFNAYYNATVEYEKGLKAMKGSVSYDRNARLQIFVSLENAAQGKQFFDRVIEKTALVIKAHPNSSIADNALLLMGRAYYYQREFAAAERKFKEVISNYTDSDVLDAATFWYGRCLAQQQQTLQAKEILGSVIASPRTSAAVRADAHFALAELAIRDEAFQEAIKQIELGLPLAVDIEQKARAAFVLARIYDQLGDFKSAATYYQAVLKLNPDFELQYAALLSYALDLREQKEYEAAERVLLRILGDDKYLDKFPEVRYELAQCYELQDRLGKALDLYIEIIRRHKKTEFSARSYLRLGLIKQEISRDYAAALAFL